MQFLVAIAAVVAGMLGLQAKTVAWYHFNEGAIGTKPANGQPVLVNAADPGSLDATPRVRQSWSKSLQFLDDNTTYLPVYTNDFPSCVSWFDPITGARGEDRQCLWMHTQYTGDGNAPIVLVDDDKKLHCANITAECMVKLTLPAGKSALSYQCHMLVMRNSAASAINPSDAQARANVKAWGLIISTSGQIRFEMQTRNSTGDAPDESKSLTLVTTSAPSVADGKWHHVAFTYDGETVRIYVDYVERASQAWSEPIDYNEDLEGRLNIAGLDVSNYGGHWYGFLDEVRISDEALPPEKFLHVGGIDTNASDPDTAIYLPFNSFEFSTDKFFGTVNAMMLHNSACSTNAALIDLSVSTQGSGIYPRLDTGVSAVPSNTLHSGIFAANAIDNIGCWTFTNNLMGSAYVGKARHIFIDDFSKNNGKHLISSGDFTAECWIKVPETPTTIPRILSENSGAKGAPTLDILLDSSSLYCKLVSQSALDDYETNKTSAAATVQTVVPISNIVGGDWHHIALVVDRTHSNAKFYVDGRLEGEHKNFVLASMVSTKNEGHAKTKIGDGYGGNNAYGLQNMSIDEFRITRRALTPQEFLMTGAPMDQTTFEPTRTWFRFEGDLSAEPVEGAIPDGVSNASTVSMTYSTDVPGVHGGRLLDGNGNLIRESNTKSMCFSGAHGSGESSADTSSQRLFFSRNLLLERDMKSMTVEFFMKGTRGEAKAWSTILRMYGNATGSDNSPFRRLWSVGYSNAAGNLYVIKDVNGTSQSTFYPDNTVSFADGRWHHIAITFAPDGTGKTLCNFYKDYQQLDSQHTFAGEMECGDYGTSSLAIGSRYNGYIDEVRVSKGVLTVDEMLHVEKNGAVILIR